MYCLGACLTSMHKTKKEKDGNGAKERRGREGKGGIALFPGHVSGHRCQSVKYRTVGSSLPLKAVGMQPRF